MVRALFHFVSVVIGDLYSAALLRLLRAFLMKSVAWILFFFPFLSFFFSLYLDVRSQSCL